MRTSARKEPDPGSELVDHDGLTTTMKVLQAKEILEELAKDAPKDDSQQPKTHGGSWLRRLFGLFRRT